MKICFLGLENLPVLAREYNTFGIGGEQVQHTLLAKALTRRGHEVSMVVYDYGQPDGAAWEGITTYKAYKARAGLPVVRYIHPRWSGVWSALKRADADVYYVSCAGMHVGLLATFCRRYGKRLVFRAAHDRDCEPDDLLIEYWRDKKLYEYGLRRCDAVLVQSARQQEAMLRNYGVESVIAEMPVDSSEKEVPYPSRGVDVLWVNNIRQFKRPDIYLELARQMPGLRFGMVGGPQPGFDVLFEQIQRGAAGLTNLVFHGRVPYHDVGPMYGDAKVFVNTSDSEGFPNSFLQSWVRGTPVISFFDPDQLIEREQLGASVSSLEQMMAMVTKFTSDQDSWQQTSKRCRAYMGNTYNEERILKPYIKVMAGEVA